MMRRVLAICILGLCLSSRLSSLPIIEATSKESEIQLSPSQKSVDVVTLRNHATEYGWILAIPELKFPFGKVKLNQEDIKDIHFTVHQGVWKMYAESATGVHYVSLMSNEDHIEMQPLGSDITTNIPVSELASIHFHTLQHKPEEDKPLPKIFYYVEFNNGEEVPVTFDKEELQLYDGQKDSRISIHQIVDVLVKDGGLHGIILDQNGQYQHIPLASIKNETVKARLMFSEKEITLKWSDILRIYQHKSEDANAISQQKITKYRDIIGKLPDEKPAAGAIIANWPTDIKLVGEEVTYDPAKMGVEEDASSLYGSEKSSEDQIEFASLEDKYTLPKKFHNDPLIDEEGYYIAPKEHIADNSQQKTKSLSGNRFPDPMKRAIK